MKANELRIGNLISDIHAGDKFSAVVNKIHEDKIYYNGFISKIEDIKEIPLTEEWLLKFGFIKNEIPTSLKDFYIVNYQLENFVVYLLENSFEIELINKSGEQFNLFINPKKEVHILQNLYFALTQRELNVA